MRDQPPTPDERDEIEERIAICIHDWELTESHAKLIAWRDMRRRRELLSERDEQ